MFHVTCPRLLLSFLGARSMSLLMFVSILHIYVSRFISNPMCFHCSMLVLISRLFFESRVFYFESHVFWVTRLDSLFCCSCRGPHILLMGAMVGGLWLGAGGGVLQLALLQLCSSRRPAAAAECTCRTCWRKLLALTERANTLYIYI